jgi:hypothetical protein
LIRGINPPVLEQQNRPRFLRVLRAVLTVAAVAVLLAVLAGSPG